MRLTKELSQEKIELFKQHASEKRQQEALSRPVDEDKDEEDDDVEKELQAFLLQRREEIDDKKGQNE